MNFLTKHNQLCLSNQIDCCLRIDGHFNSKTHKKFTKLMLDLDANFLFPHRIITALCRITKI